MYTLFFILTLVIFFLLMMMFHPSTVAWLEARDDAIRSRPAPEFFRDTWILKAFYPGSRKGKLPPVDKLLIWVVVAAIILVFYEIGAILSFFPEDENMIAGLTCVLLAIFIFEFLLRFSMKGLVYMGPWGGIDLLVILIDLLTVLIFFGYLDVILSVVGLSDQSPEGAAVLRVLRIARLFRTLKLVRYAFEKQRRQMFWRRIKPHLNALLKLTFIVCVIAFFFGSVISIARDQSPFEGWKAILQQVISSLGSNNEGDPFALAAAVLIVAALANMIAIFYAPVMERIRVEQSKLSDLDLLEGHIIICLNDEDSFGGFLEELIHVFNKSADKQVFIIDENITTVNLADWDNIRVVKGASEDPATWRNCAAHAADAVILLGKHDVLSDRDFYNFLCPGRSRDANDAVLFDIVSEGEDYVRSNLGDHAYKVQVNLPNLINLIEENAWNRRSLQFAFLHKLTDEFEDYLEFPDLSGFKGDNALTEQLAKILYTELNVKVSQRGNNLLIDLTVGDDSDLEIPEELLELRRLEAVIATLKDNPELSVGTCVFAYVAAFELISRNADLSDDPNAHLSVFAIEFAAALSLFHELIAPGVLKGWFLDRENLEKANNANDILHELQNRQRLLSPSSLANKLELEDEQVVVGLLDDEGRLSVTTRNTNRFSKNKAGFAIVL